MQRDRQRLTFFGIAVIFSVMIISSSDAFAAAAGGPSAVVRNGTNKAIEILKSSQSGKGPGIRARRAEILTILDEYFNFPEMARRALGRPWKEQKPEKQQEFVALFKQLLFNTYIDRVESYTYSNEEVLYDKESLDGDYALVQTRVKGGYKNTDLQVDYRLRRENGVWRVYDVIVEGVSFIDNYRSQFSSMLASSTFDDLLRKMKEKNAQQSQGS